jgi:hypothetical protein
MKQNEVNIFIITAVLSSRINATHHQHRRNNLMREVSVHRKRRLITHYVLQLGL